MVLVGWKGGGAVKKRGKGSTRIMFAAWERASK